MIRPEFFVEKLRTYGIDFYAGIPDSLLKDLCAYLSSRLDDRHNIIAANEGAAVGLAAGYHLATGSIPVVYMQNSGEGNCINPLASLIDRDVYHIPVLLLIGWRGQPGTQDEPQHIKQGKITTDLLDVMGISHYVLSKEEGVAAHQIDDAVKAMHKTGDSFALVIEKETFAHYKAKDNDGNIFPLSREEAICITASAVGERDIIVSTTGMISRELFEFRTRQGNGHKQDFLTVGSMGHASQIALGIALEKPQRKIWCFDGDGSVIMHMGSLAIAASMAPTNYIHVVFNNGAHDSVGGQPTVGLRINLPAIAKAAGYPIVFSVESENDLQAVLDRVGSLNGPVFIEIKVRKGHRNNLGRPTTTPLENKSALMSFLKD